MDGLMVQLQYVLVAVSWTLVTGSDILARDQLYTFPVKVFAYLGSKGFIFVSNCNGSICLNGNNMMLYKLVSIELGQNMEPSILGFLDKRLYIGFTKDKSDFLTAIDFRHGCAMTKCPVVTEPISKASYRMTSGSMDLIGNRMLLIYRSIGETVISSRVCSYTPELRGTRCFYKTDTVINHAEYDSIYSILYYSVCYFQQCSVFRMALDASTGFPEVLGAPSEILCISNQIAGPVFSLRYIYFEPELHYPIKEGASYDVWSTKLRSCLPEKGPLLPVNTSQLFSVRDYTVGLVPPSTILLRSTVAQGLLEFHDKIHLLTALSFDKGYSFDQPCLLPDSLSPQLILVPIYRNVAQLFLKRPYVTTTEFKSLEEFFASKCQNISLPCFRMVASVVQHCAHQTSNSNITLETESSRNGILTLSGLTVGCGYTINANWSNKYTRALRMTNQVVSLRIDWTEDAYPQLATLSALLHEAGTTNDGLKAPSNENNSENESPYRVSIFIAISVLISVIAFVTASLKMVSKRNRPEQFAASKDAIAAVIAEDIDAANIRTAASPFVSRAAIYTRFRMQGLVAPDQFPALLHFSMADVQVLQEVGSGAFGTVFKIRFTEGSQGKPPGIFAMKYMTDIKDMIAEAKVMIAVEHINIVRVYGICLDPEYPNLALEYMDGGNLLNHLRSLSSKYMLLTAVEVMSIMKDVASALSYLEERKLVHRDVAARNCLLSQSGAPCACVKLADFGLTRPAPKDYYRLQNCTMLPIRWLAPECITTNVFTSKTDMWSFGILAWEIITLGATPYPGKTEQEVVDFLQIGGRPIIAGSNSNINHIMNRCWEVNPDIRSAAKEVLDYIHNMEFGAHNWATSNELYYLKQLNQNEWLLVADDSCRIAKYSTDI